MGMWIGWLVALIAAIALGLLWQWLRREIAERSEVERDHALLDAQIGQLRAQHEQVMKIDHLAGLGQLLAGAAQQVVEPVSTAREHIDGLANQWIEHRNVAAAYDEAIQHCLAPLDLMVGVDTSELDAAQLGQLVIHIGVARRRLFDARAAWIASPFGSEAPTRLRDLGSCLETTEQLLKGLGGGPRPGDPGAEPVEINQVLDAALLMAARHLGDHVRVVRRYAELPSVRGSFAQIHQLALHLIINACQAIPDSGVLTLETRVGEAGTVEIDIADTGVGISDEVLPRIFEPFFTSRPNVQQGLGLSAVHRIVKAHHGSIQVRTQPGSGTRFGIVLPVSGRAASNVTPLFRQREIA